MTPRISSAIVTMPCMLANAGQLLTGNRPRVMFTPRIRSLIVTWPSSPQSPTQVPGGGVGVGVGVAPPVVKSTVKSGRTDTELSRLSKRFAVTRLASSPIRIQPKLLSG